MVASKWIYCFPVQGRNPLARSFLYPQGVQKRCKNNFLWCTIEQHKWPWRTVGTMSLEKYHSHHGLTPPVARCGKATESSHAVAHEATPFWIINGYQLGRHPFSCTFNLSCWMQKNISMQGNIKICTAKKMNSCIDCKSHKLSSVLEFGQGKNGHRTHKHSLRCPLSLSASAKLKRLQPTCSISFFINWAQLYI